MNPTEPFRSGMSIYTSRAIDRLKNGKPGDAISREEMSKQIGRGCEPRTNGYGNVCHAINHVESHFGVVWKWSRNEHAWICLDEAGKANEAKSRGDSGARRIRRGLRVAATVDRSKLSDADRGQFDRTVIQLEMSRMMTSAPMAKRLEQSSAIKAQDFDAIANLMAPKK